MVNLIGEISEGFLEEVTFEPNLKEREKCEQANIGREPFRPREQLEQ